jgi:hypothetical protein
MIKATDETQINTDLEGPFSLVEDALRSKEAVASTGNRW